VSVLEAPISALLSVHTRVNTLAGVQSAWWHLLPKERKKQSLEHRISFFPFPCKGRFNRIAAGWFL